MNIYTKKGNAKDGGFLIRGNVHITRRELMVLMLMTNGISNVEIAKRFGIKIQTVRYHLRNMVKKLGAGNLANAVAMCIHFGMLRLAWYEDRSVEDEGGKQSLYVWCLHCERTYPRGQFRKIEGEKLVVNNIEYDTSYDGCLYEDCSGSAVIDVFDWNKIRLEHLAFPEIPEKGKAYPLYQS